MEFSGSDIIVTNNIIFLHQSTHFNISEGLIVVSLLLWGMDNQKQTSKFWKTFLISIPILKVRIVLVFLLSVELKTLENQYLYLCNIVLMFHLISA